MISTNRQRLFLIDGLGALLSAFFLGIVLVRFETTFGMPQNILCFLAALACLFAVYSFCCYIFIKDNWRPYLRSIAIANLTYCCITFGLIVTCYESLTILGVGYFVVELLILGILVAVEFKMTSN
jgi:hypothetical protein